MIDHGIVTEDVRGAFADSRLSWPPVIDPSRGPVRMSLSSGVQFTLGKVDLYFIGTAGGPVKIGSSCNPKSRLRSLQTAHPYPLRLLAVLPNGGYLESDYHAHFAPWRLSGEWFTRCPEIEVEIARLGGGL